uniref:Uncharacterized protein n=1 Tax=Octopus bimaculoides TaxID=37653 RepID=A0A0L8HIN8_OCTBM
MHPHPKPHKFTCTPPKKLHKYTHPPPPNTVNSQAARPQKYVKIHIFLFVAKVPRKSRLSLYSLSLSFTHLIQAASFSITCLSTSYVIPIARGQRHNAYI